jgi:hypothetical protein
VDDVHRPAADRVCRRIGRISVWAARMRGLPRGTELIEPRADELGRSLTLADAMRGEGRLTLATSWVPMTTGRFAAWARRHLLRVLRPREIVIMDNLAAHKSRRVQHPVASVGGTAQFLPPHSYDVPPIEHAWALIEQRPRRFAPRTGVAPNGRAARAGRSPTASLSQLDRPRRRRTQVMSGNWIRVPSRSGILFESDRL